MGLFDNFPYTNFHELNLDWVLKTIKTMDTEFKTFISQNAIKYANPIQWNITTQYEKNTVVIDVTGNGYLSVQAVPSGISIEREEYWTLIGNFSALWGSVKNAITTEDEGHSTTATKTRNVGDLVWLENTLIEVTTNMSIGTAYAVGTNCIIFSMQKLVSDIIAEATARANADTVNANAIETEETARATADALLRYDLDEEVTAREDGDTENANAIAAEATARANADTANANAIAAETTARQNADTANANAIAAETTARQNADTAINEQIGIMQDAIEALELTEGNSLFKKDMVNMAEYVNCIGDGINYDDVAFQHAVNNYKVVLVPEPNIFYRFQHTVNIPSDTKIIGLGKPHIYNNTANAEPIFKVVGTSGNRLKNVAIENLKIQNGLASAGDYIEWKDGIEIKYCDGFTLENCEITEIQGRFGFSSRYSTNLDIIGNRFYRCTYAHVMILPECENVYVKENIFDTTTSLTTPDTYLFATGGGDLVDNWSCKNIWVLNNKFLNNPRWEAIDSHGAENIWIENNYIENVRMGIMVGLALGQVTNMINKNIHINKNVVKQGTGQDGYYGIIVKGNYNSASFILAENVEITENEVVGFGSTSLSTVGAINLYCTNNTVIEHNKIRDFKGAGVLCENTNWNFKVKNNEIMNPTAKNSEVLALGVYVRYTGNDGVIENNKIGYTDNSKNIVRGIRVASVFNHVRVYKNEIMSSEYNYDGVGYYNVEKTETPSGIMGAQHDICTDANQMPKYYCTNAPLRFASAQASGITVSGVAGSNELSIVTGSFDYLLPGMEIVIAGAGAGGAALTAQIIKLTNTKITLKTNLSTNVTNAGVSYTNASWVVL